MSGRIVITWPDSIEIFTDTAAYFSEDDAAEIIGFVAKQFSTAATEPAIVSPLGLGDVGAAFVGLQAGRDLDAIEANAADDLRRALQECGDSPEGKMCEIAMSGYSRRHDKFQTLLIADKSTAYLGSEAFAIEEAAPCYVVGAGDAIEAILDDFWNRFGGHFSDDPETRAKAPKFTAADGVAMMDRMRADAYLPIAGSIAHGHVTRDGATISIAHEWPDRIGDRFAVAGLCDSEQQEAA